MTTKEQFQKHHMSLCILFFFACKAVGLDSEKARMTFLESDLCKRFSVLTVDDLWRISEIAYATEETMQESFTG